MLALQCNSLVEHKNTQIMLQIEKLTFGYKKNKILFSELDLKLEKGKVYGLLGKNGSGKTTLLKQMAGMLFPKKGRITINNVETKKRSVETLDKYFFLPEEFEMPNLSMKNFIKTNAPFYKSFDNEKFKRYVEEFDLPTQNKLDKMSYGQKKKMLISFALASETPILFSDEPTNGLDIPSKSTFRQLMAQSITDDKLFIISTHQIKDIEGIIDAVVIVNDGKIIFNQELYRIAEVLCFKTVENINAKNILYAEKHLNSYNVIAKNTGQENSRIDLEILFNALISKNAKNIQNLF